MWLIKAETNLHVGNENNSGYGIIDKAIQRDAVTSFPCINSSSLKGAINEYCTVVADSTPEQRIRIFGADKNGKASGSQKGGVVFFDAQLLFLPVQDNDTVFKYATCLSVLNMFIDRIETMDSKFDLGEKTLKNIKDNNSLSDGDKKSLANVLMTKFGLNKPVAIKSDKEFCRLCNDENLPIIARNKLENGLSANLWYEQILPSKSVLYFFTNGSGEDTETLLDWLDNKLVQIGANATIGYGYCRLRSYPRTKTKVENPENR